jgi:ankyrin repeat protein
MEMIETVSKNGGTALHVAAVFDSRRTIKVLLDLDVDVSSTVQRLFCAMMFSSCCDAIMMRCAVMTPHPLSALVQVNARDNMMETAMHKAARRNFILAYNMLKAAGGRDTLLNLMGETPADVLVDR